jgi:hypothetical protein
MPVLLAIDRYCPLLTLTAPLAPSAAYYLLPATIATPPHPPRTPTFVFLATVLGAPPPLASSTASAAQYGACSILQIPLATDNGADGDPPPPSLLLLLLLSSFVSL